MDRLVVRPDSHSIAPSGAAAARLLAERAFARATDAELVAGNAVRILRDATEHFPAWLEAIRAARDSIFLESYIIADDAIGREFLHALIERARAGVRVHVIFDWLGSLLGRKMWTTLAAAGGEIRCFNPPRLDEPFGWTMRDHRKMLAVDGAVGFVTGLCLSGKWHGNPARGIAPWRDTGIELRGPAVRHLETAFARVWRTTGAPLPADALTANPAPPAGDIALRVVASEPDTANVFRLDQLIAAVAREHLWLTDAYFVGFTPYVRALCAAAADGVDVRLLVPGASDLPLVSRLSRAGYRPLLEAGVRIFEWNGSMLHAKTAVADGYWARVGSTNLNFASWMNNYELDVAIEDPRIAAEMAVMYEEDLRNATEIVLGRRRRVTTAIPRPARARAHARRAFSGSAGRAAAGALTVGSALGAALTRRRELGPTEASVLATFSAVLCGAAILALAFPRAFAIPFSILAGWMGLALLWRAVRLGRRARADARRSRAK